MAQVVIVGGGFAGLSAAARLAKWNHHVTVIEQSPRLGGRLLPLETKIGRFNLSTPYVTLPGVFRDLFRKSGRQMDRTLDFTPIDGRSHYFYKQDRFDLPLGHRGDHAMAIEKRFHYDIGWTLWLDEMEPTWDLLRRLWFDRVPQGPKDLDRSHRKAIDVKTRLTKVVRKRLDDNDVDDIVLNRHIIDGHDISFTPWFVSIVDYLERNFGLWAFDGGTEGLAAALTTRLEERKVDVITDTTAKDVTWSDDKVTGVDTEQGHIPAEIVVWCAPPPHRYISREMPIIAPARTLLTLDPEFAESLPLDATVHSDPPLRFHREDHHLTIEHRGGEDVLVSLARCRLDLREGLVDRHDLSPVDLAMIGHWGYTWNRWTTMTNIPGVDPQGGLFFAGAHAHPGGSLEMIGIGTAALANALGKAERKR